MDSTYNYPPSPDTSRENPGPLTHTDLLEIILDQSVNATLVFNTFEDSTGPFTTFIPELANRQAKLLFGLSDAFGLNQFAPETLPDWLTTYLNQHAAQVIRTGQPHQSEQVYTDTKTSASIWLDVNLRPVGDGQRIVVYLTDVTSFKQDALSWQKDATLFRTLASNIPQMSVLVIDKSDTVTLAMGVMPGLLDQQQPEALIGRSLLESVMADYQPDWERYLHTALAGETHFFSDHWNAWRCECYVGPVPGPAHEVTGALVVFRNVTEEYHQQQALQALNQALQQSNEQLERFAFVASHDLQEPLRKIQLFSNLIRERASDRISAGEQDMLSRMQSAAYRMGELIQSLLSLARLNGKPPVQALVNLTDLFSTLVSDLAVRIQEREAIVEVVPPLPLVPGDAPQLRQLFQNLLTNALKFTAPDVAPRIKIQTRLMGGQDLAGLRLDTRSQYVEISVIDNGIGIADQHLEHIFGVFNRLHGWHQYAGTGIGLATVRKVVDNHQGIIQVESQEGVGTTMRVYLPVAPVSEDSQTEPVG